MTDLTTVKGEVKFGQLSKKHHFDAGLDISANEFTVIPPKSSALIATGLYIGVPEGHVGLLWSRSGLSVNHSIEVGAGCIDSGYHGEVKVHLYNHGDSEFYVNAGDRIAQLLTLPVNLNRYTRVVEFSDEKNQGEKRGVRGFGSTGVSRE